MAKVLESMKFIIAELYAKDRKTAIGYRLADVRLGNDIADVKDVPTNSVIGAMKNGMTFENVAVVNDKIVGIQGSIERLPKIVLGEAKPFENNNMTIVNKMGDVGYKVMDFAGRTKKYRTEDAIALIDKGVFQDLTNGKIVERDGLKFISAINGEYRIQAIKDTTKIKITSKDVIDGQKNQRILSNAVRLENRVVKEEIEYNDTFKILNADQRKALEMYYTWWTTTTFNSLVGKGREALKANPKKVAALAELRGKDIKWEYGGTKLARLMNPQGVEYCSLGHKLQIVHFADGVDLEGNSYRIKFGSTCVSDFFDIDPKAMTVLTKVTDTMKNEIEAVTKMAEDKQLDVFREKTRMVEDIYKATGKKTSAMNNIFTPVLAKYIIIFIECGLPIPESLLRMVRESQCLIAKVKLDDDLNPVVAVSFWRKVFEELGLSLTIQDKLRDAWRYRASIMQRLQLIEKLAFIPGVEGIYGYDPINKIGHRGKGRFTAEAARERKMDLHACKRIGCENGIPSFKDVVDTYLTCQVYEKLGQKVLGLIQNKAEALGKLGYNVENEKSKLKSKIIRDADNVLITNKSDALGYLAIQAFIIGWDIVEPIQTYTSMASHAFPVISRYSLRAYGVNADELPEFNIHSKTEIEKFALSNKDKFMSVIENLINKRIEEYKKEQEAELLEKKRQEEEAKKKKLAEIQKKDREAIICTNMNCIYNDDGSCKKIIENGIDRDKQTLGEYDTIKRCDLYSDTEEDDTKQKEQITDLDRYLDYVSAIAQKDIKIDNPYKEIAHNISVKVTDDSDLSFKQRRVIQRATKVYREELAELGWILQGKDLVKGTEDEKSKHIKDSDNWVKLLKDEPEISKEVEKILKAAADGDDRLTTKIVNIAFSVRKYGKISAKQYKNINEGIERLK